MQVIPADWQNKIEQHIVTMEQAMSYALKVGPGDEHSRRWEMYKGTCDAFFDELDTLFNSGDGFIDFMKSRTRNAYRLCGYDDIPEKRWIDISEGKRTCHDAQNIAAHYKFHYKGHMDYLSAKANKSTSAKQASTLHLNNV